MFNQKKKKSLILVLFNGILEYHFRFKLSSNEDDASLVSGAQPLLKSAFELKKKYEHVPS